MLRRPELWVRNLHRGANQSTFFYIIVGRYHGLPLVIKDAHLDSIASFGSGRHLHFCLVSLDAERSEVTSPPVKMLFVGQNEFHRAVDACARIPARTLL